MVGIVGSSRVVMVAAVCLGIHPLPLCAQTTDSLLHGTRVRVSHHRLPHSIVGTAQGWRGDSLLLDVSGARQAFALTSLSQVEVSRGTKTNALTGAVVGLGVGLAVRSERWEAVAVAPPEGRRVGARRWRIGLTVSF